MKLPKVVVEIQQSGDLSATMADAYLRIEHKFKGRPSFIHARAFAVRDSEDSYDPYVGSLLATARALQFVVNKLTKVANGLVKNAEDNKQQQLVQAFTKQIWEQSKIENRKKSQDVEFLPIRGVKTVSRKKKLVASRKKGANERKKSRSKYK